MSAMRRSSTSPDGRRSGWRSTARVTAAAEPRAGATNRVGRLSEGTLVEASVVGRVLGVRVLTLDAVVLLSPAATPQAPAPPRPLLPRRRGLAEAVRRIEEGEEVLAEARRLRQSGGVPARSSTTAAGRVPPASGGVAAPGRS